LNRWVALIARDVGRAYETHTERTSAEDFVRSHRLSIARAFERKLCRKDVVAELARLFKAERSHGVIGQLEIKNKTEVPFPS
jgi:hypothetical protein